MDVYVSPPRATGCLKCRILLTCEQGLADRSVGPCFLGGNIMRLVKIDATLFEIYREDQEVLTKTKRPYVLVLRLAYKDDTYDFAVPLRSNISASAPKDQYFPLPTRSTTRSQRRHGLHYIKMFPVTKQFFRRYRTEGNPYATLIQRVINENVHQIVKECQAYLDAYAKGVHPQYSTDIDYLLMQLKTSVIDDEIKER